MRPHEISQTVHAQATVDFSGLTARLCGPHRMQRVLKDCPGPGPGFRPFLVPALAGEPDNFVLAPLRPDTAPMAHTIAALLK